MKKPEACDSIEDVRTQIDAIDAEILRLLGLRFSFAKEIVRFKSNSSEIVAQQRYDAVIARRRAMAIDNGLNPDVIETIYRSLMNHFIEEEMKLLKQKTTAPTREA